MIHRISLYCLCLSTIFLFGCTTPLDPDEGSEPTPEQPTTPEQPVLPPGPVDPDNPDIPVDPDNPSNPDKPTDPDKPIAPTDPSNPDNPTDPEGPSFTPKVLLFENFETASVPEGFQIYDEDKQPELFPNPSGTWKLGIVGGGAASFCMFKGTSKSNIPIAIGSSVPVDNWIVTRGMMIERVHTRLSWDMIAAGYETPANAVDSYEVYISTAGQSVAQMKATQPVYSTSTLGQGKSESIEINLDQYIGQTIYVAFRHCTPIHNMTILRLFNVKVKEHYGLDLSANRVKMRSVYKPNEQVSVSADIYNNGLGVTSVTATYTYASQKVTQTFPVNIANNQYATVTFSQKLTVDKLGESHPISVEVAADENNLNNYRATQIICPDKEPKKRVLAEKVTSASCGPCGSIINTLDEAEQKHPDTVIGVAIHVTFPSGDAMACLSYLSWVSPFYGWPAGDVKTAPKCSMNKIDEIGYPTIPSSVLKYYNLMVSPAALSVDVSYDPISKVITASANTVFASDATCSGYFRLGFVVTEDGLQNRQNGATTNIHNHTARELIGGPKGFENSLPDKVEKGIKNTYTISHSIPAKYDNDGAHPPKVENMSVVAILYDDMTGEVLNCARTKVIQ